VEEAYELADAAHSGDDAKLLDELGDVLFQVLFLALLLEEREAGDLATVAEHCRQKLIRRHPHVFGDVEAKTAADVVRTWSAVKREEERGEDLLGDLPETLPATLYAKKLLKRAAAAGRTAPAGDDSGDPFESAGDRLLAAVQSAVERGVDPELALRSAADRMRRSVEEEVGG
jgi:uncharacterized protein YabN with tetrapyrrole methylase and pyrophosphatase domain